MTTVRELGPGARFDMYNPKGTVVVLGKQVKDRYPVKVTGKDEDETEYTSIRTNDLLTMLQSRKGGFSNLPPLDTSKDTNIFVLLNDGHLWNRNSTDTNNNFIVSFDQTNVINGVFADTPQVEKDKLDKYVTVAIKPNEISLNGWKNIPSEFYGQLEIVNWLLGYS